MDAQTWDSQPYWAQRVYTEGLYTERPWQTKLDSDPATWFSTLDLQWETFGELKNATIDQQEANTGIDETTEDDEEFIKWKHLPDITELVKPTYIDLE